MGAISFFKVFLIIFWKTVSKIVPAKLMVTLIIWVIIGIVVIIAVVAIVKSLYNWMHQIFYLFHFLKI